MPADPLVGLVSRALEVQVDGIEVERIGEDRHTETDRIRWSGPTGTGSLWFYRMSPATSVESSLLPFLARRGVAVPRVLASGVPPRHVKEPRPWVIMEEPPVQTLCERLDVEVARRTGAALSALQAATRRDASTLQALGVRGLPPTRVRAEALEAADLLPSEEASRLRTLADTLDVVALSARAETLVHGAAVCSNVRVGGRDVVLVNWSRAHLGCDLEDIAALCADLRERDAALAAAAVEGFGTVQDDLRQPELLHRLCRVRSHASEIRAGSVSRDEGVALIRGEIEKVRV